MLIGAAVCPATPLLVPEVAADAASELAQVRGMALAAVRRLVTLEPDLLVIVAAGFGYGVAPSPMAGTFRSFGVDIAVGSRFGSPRNGATDCPGLLVASWLLERATPMPLRCLGWRVGTQSGVLDCVTAGRSLYELSPRVALLAMGDGSARRTDKAPGYLDERAVGYDDALADALTRADANALTALDPLTSEALMASGRAPLQVLAGAVLADRRQWSGDLLRYDAPYGVGYFVAVLEPSS